MTEKHDFERELLLTKINDSAKTILFVTSNYTCDKLTTEQLKGMKKIIIDMENLLTDSI